MLLGIVAALVANLGPYEDAIRSLLVLSFVAFVNWAAKTNL
jgi:hypothetical protein